MKVTMKKVAIEIVEGDITESETDAIVNAANSSLMGGGGVDGAIHRKGGISISRECETIRTNEWLEGLPTGKAVITGGGNLRAKYVIHTVGPIWRGGHSHESKLLSDCYTNSLALASSRRLRSLSFPSISTGAFGYPIELACCVALESTKNFLQREQGSLEEILFVLFTTRDLRTYEEAARRIFKIEQ